MKLVSRLTVVFTLLLALVFGLVLPAFAASPAQASSPADPLNSLLAFLLTALTGGALAYLLDDLPLWKNWVSPLKPYAAMVLTGIAGIALVALQQYGVPQYFPQLPAQAQFAIAWLATYLLSQLAHQHDIARSVESVRGVAVQPWEGHAITISSGRT